MKVDFTDHPAGHAPNGKLADATLLFPDDGGPLAGLKLIGFAVWERKGGGTKRNVTFPSRTYRVGGESRPFALLRPTNDVSAAERLREYILAAYAAHEAARPTEASS